MKRIQKKEDHNSTNLSIYTYRTIISNILFWFVRILLVFKLMNKNNNKKIVRSMH